ncbi:MAG TPA: molybdenum ABC transporter ATP-binding protein [Methylotenera sp.]|nr:molybdenum ABC transporter ATP-binding protein [Methylotenera sp.]
MIDIDLTRVQGNFSLHAKCMLEAPVVGLFGPSGAGKSTLLGLIAGLIKPNAGHLILNGETLFNDKQAINVPLHQRRIGVVFQDSRLFPHLNVRDNLEYGFNLLTAKDRHLGFNQIVELLEIGKLLTQKPHQLSGGEKQRVALGRALLTSPRLLLLDEPLASLDVRLKHQILPFLRRVKDEINIPMIYVSHAIDEILYLTSHIAMLDHGEILAVGQFNEVIHDQQVLTLAHSLGLENVLHVQVLEHHPDDGFTVTRLASQQINIPLVNSAIASIVSLSVAASNIALSTHKIKGVTIQNQLVGTVTNIQRVDTRVLISVDIGHEIIAEVTAKAIHDMQIELGATVYCLIKTQSIHPLATIA